MDLEELAIANSQDSNNQFTIEGVSNNPISQWEVK